MMKLDAYDRRILDALQHNNQLTNRELAERVHLSTAACRRRVQRLRKEGVIVADVSIVDPEAVGIDLTMIVTVTLERDHTAVLQQFHRAVQDAPEVQSCYCVTGMAGFVLIVTVANMREYEAFAARFFDDSPIVRSFHSRAVIRRNKFSVRIRIV